MVFSPVVVHSIKDAKEDAFRAVAQLTLPWLDLRDLYQATGRPLLFDSVPQYSSFARAFLIWNPESF